MPADFQKSFATPCGYAQRAILNTPGVYVLPISEYCIAKNDAGGVVAERGAGSISHGTNILWYLGCSRSKL